MTQTAEPSAMPSATAGQQIAVVPQPNGLLQRPMHAYLHMVAIDVPDRGSHADSVRMRDA